MKRTAPHRLAALLGALALLISAAVIAGCGGQGAAQRSGSSPGARTQNTRSQSAATSQSTTAQAPHQDSAAVRNELSSLYYQYGPATLLTKSEAAHAAGLADSTGIEVSSNVTNPDASPTLAQTRALAYAGYNVDDTTSVDGGVVIKVRKPERGAQVSAKVAAACTRLLALMRAHPNTYSPKDVRDEEAACAYSIADDPSTTPPTAIAPGTSLRGFRSWIIFEPGEAFPSVFAADETYVIEINELEYGTENGKNQFAKLTRAQQVSLLQWTAKLVLSRFDANRVEHPNLSGD